MLEGKRWPPHYSSEADSNCKKSSSSIRWPIRHSIHANEYRRFSVDPWSSIPGLQAPKKTVGSRSFWTWSNCLGSSHRVTRRTVRRPEATSQPRTCLGRGPGSAVVRRGDLGVGHHRGRQRHRASQEIAEANRGIVCLHQSRPLDRSVFCRPYRGALRGRVVEQGRPTRCCHHPRTPIRVCDLVSPRATPRLA